MEFDLEAFLMNCTEFFLAIFSTTDATEGPLTGPDVAETSAATASAFWMESSALFSLLVTVTLALTCSALTSGSGSLVLVAAAVGGLGAGAFFLAVPVAADDLDAAPPGGVESL